MSLFLQQIRGGIASDSLFAILDLAIVLIQRARGLLNLAQGDLALRSTFSAWSVSQEE